MKKASKEPGPVVLLSSSSPLHGDDLNPRPGLVGAKPEDCNAESGLREDPKERFHLLSSNMLFPSTFRLSHEPRPMVMRPRPAVVARGLG